MNNLILYSDNEFLNNILNSEYIKAITSREGYIIINYSNILWQYSLTQFKSLKGKVFYACTDLIEENGLNKKSLIIKIEDIYSEDRDTKIDILGRIMRMFKL